METIRSHSNEGATVEDLQRSLIMKINEQIPFGATPESERIRLEKLHGRVWNTKELTKEFRVLGFRAPLVLVRNLLTNQLGTMLFQHYPRYYFGFVPEEQ